MEKKRILIIEDNEMNREILTYMMEDTYAVLTANNGAEGLELLRKHGDSIALIFLDIQMSVMNGYEFMEAVRKDGIYIDIPIIVTTAGNDEAAQIRCLEMGASDFISKPYDPKTVRKRAESLIRLKETTLLLHKIERDRLTGLYTLESFSEYAGQMLKTDPNSKYDMVCMEVESYSTLLNSYGADKCAAIVRTLARLLKTTLPKNVLMGRVGEDKFALLMKHMPIQEFRQYMIWCRAIPNQPPMPASKVNFGIYANVDSRLGVSEIMNRAMLSIIQVRGHYDRNIAEFDQEFCQKMEQAQIITDTAEKALGQRQFLVYYQPKTDAQTGRISGAEALVRWEHPTLGFLGPGSFIQIFEQNGFIYELDKYVLSSVCMELRRWLTEGKEPVPVSVNLSQLDFDQPGLAEILEEIVDSYGIPHHLIHFEITETRETDNKRKRAASVEFLSQKGFPIELDDFGSGFSTLQVLGELPVNVIKLDIGLTRNMFAPRYHAVVRSALFAAEMLRCQVVAEGVENRKQLDALKEMSGGKLKLHIQGYLISPPVPADKFEQMLT